MKKVTKLPANSKIAAGKKFMDKSVMSQGKAKSKPVMKDAKPGCKYPKGV